MTARGARQRCRRSGRGGPRPRHGRTRPRGKIKHGAQSTAARSRS